MVPWASQRRTRRPLVANQRPRNPPISHCELAPTGGLISGVHYTGQLGQWHNCVRGPSGSSPRTRFGDPVRGDARWTRGAQGIAVLSTDARGGTKLLEGMDSHALESPLPRRKSGYVRPRSVEAPPYQSPSPCRRSSTLQGECPWGPGASVVPRRRAERCRASNLHRDGLESVGSGRVLRRSGGSRERLGLRPPVEAGGPAFLGAADATGY
jgi:hypothetical protein